MTTDDASTIFNALMEIKTDIGLLHGNMDTGFKAMTNRMDIANGRTLKLEQRQHDMELELDRVETAANTCNDGVAALNEKVGPLVDNEKGSAWAYSKITNTSTLITAIVAIGAIAMLATGWHISKV